MKTVEELQKHVENWDPEEGDEYIRYHLALGILEKKEKIENDFLAFVKELWPNFIEGKHHREIADKFNEISKGKLKRLIINMPPRIPNQNLHLTFFLHGWLVSFLI